MNDLMFDAEGRYNDGSPMESAMLDRATPRRFKKKLNKIKTKSRLEKEDNNQKVKILILFKLTN